MKIGFYLIVLICFVLASCSNKISYQPELLYDDGGKLAVKPYLTKYYINFEGKRLVTDTICNYYHYYPNNTLSYFLKGWQCDTMLGLYVSKYFYKFDTAKDQIQIVGFFYKRCNDNPIKVSCFYNTKGTLLKEISHWVHNHIDTACRGSQLNTKYNYDVFDTTDYNQWQLKQKRTDYVYNEDNILKLAIISNYTSTTNHNEPYYTIANVYSVDTLNGEDYSKWFKDDHQLSQNYLTTSQAREHTIIPFLKALDIE